MAGKNTISSLPYNCFLLSVVQMQGFLEKSQSCVVVYYIFVLHFVFKHEH